MGAVGGLLGLNGGAGGTGFSPNAGTNSGQLATSYNQNQALLSALQGQNGIGNQSQVYNQLQNVAAGQGPNPAQAMLNQATGANVANQAALQAGQRGASQNVGLAARNAALAGTNAQQQAAGQGATMQANQALGALGQAGQLANTQAGQQIGATQNEQNILQNANTAYSQQQAGLAGQTMQGQQGLVGGVLNGVGGAIGSIFAKGGEVQKFDRGGSVAGPQSNFGKFLTSSQNSSPMFNLASGAGAQALQQGASNLFNVFQKKPNQSSAQANAGMPQAVQQFNNDLVAPTGSAPIQNASVDMIGAKGGNVGDKLKSGGHVPGQAKVSGNSYKNDTVKALLSPGEVVIPRSVMSSKDPVRGAAQFVQSVMAKKKGRG